MQCYLFNFAIATLERGQMWIFLSKRACAGIFYVSAGGSRFGFLALPNIVICCTNATFFF